MLRGNRRKVTFNPCGLVDDVRVLSDMRAFYDLSRRYSHSQIIKLRQRIVRYIAFKKRIAINNTYRICLSELRPICVEAVLSIARNILEKEVKVSPAFIERKLSKILPKVSDLQNMVINTDNPGEFEINSRSGKIFYKWEDEFQKIADSFRRNSQL